MICVIGKCRKGIGKIELKYETKRYTYRKYGESLLFAMTGSKKLKECLEDERGRSDFPLNIKTLFNFWLIGGCEKILNELPKIEQECIDSGLTYTTSFLTDKKLINLIISNVLTWNQRRISQRIEGVDRNFFGRDIEGKLIGRDIEGKLKRSKDIVERQIHQPSFYQYMIQYNSSLYYAFNVDYKNSYFFIDEDSNEGKINYFIKIFEERILNFFLEKIEEDKRNPNSINKWSREEQYSFIEKFIIKNPR